ncbi:MAG: hypothetical protein ACO1SV_00670 [Fimbriimonas sp.]
MSSEIRDLSPAAAALIHSLIEAAEPRAPGSVPTEVRDRFVCGLASEAERGEVVGAMYHDADLRRELVEAKRALRAALETPKAAGPAQRLIDALWRHAERLRTVARRRAGDAAVDGVARQVIAAWRAESSLRLATSRGEEDRVHLGPGLPTLIAETFAAHWFGGELRASARADDAALEGERLTLELRDPAGGALPIADGIVSDGAWAVTVVGEGLVPDLVLPRAAWAIRGTGAPRGETVRTLYADASLVAAGTDATVIALEVLSPPRIEGGEFSMTIRVPSGARPTLGGCRLQISIPAGSADLGIGRWEFHPETDEWTLAASGIPLADGSFDCPSVLRAAFVAA